MNQIAKEVNVSIDSGIVVQNNQVEVYVTNKSDFQNHLTQMKKQLPQNVVIVERPSAIPASTWYGGLSLSGCTAGFSLREQSTGKRFSSSAGHCLTGDIMPLSFYRSYNYGAYDFSVLNIGSNDIVKNWAKDNYASDSTPFYREITGITVSANIGDFSCKYGKNTGFTCGTIEDNHYNYNGRGSTWYLFKSSSTTQVLICGGDSGGPWYSGSIAYGYSVAHFGCNASSNNKAVVMPIARTMDQGFDVLTSP